MDEFIFLLVIAAIGLVVTGPVAVILTLILFGKIGSINRRLNQLEGKHMPGVDYTKPSMTQPEVTVEPAKPEPVVSPPPPIQQKPESIQTPPLTVPEESMEVAAAMETFSPAKPETVSNGSFELTIGIRVLLIAGIITVIFGVGFFLKHIYETMTFGPVARVSIVAGGGLLALVIGEVLRRIDFGIVAKGITALGFALLYAAVFSGSRVYQLFSLEAAFILSIAVTIAAMSYAVALNEVLIAFLALLGGYLSPVIISTGQNLPMPLFSYVLVLSIGAMGCATFRRWRVVNWMALLGTYLLYTGWFEKFYDDEQMAIALGWLGVFGGIYLTVPILHGLIRKLTARAEDVPLVLVNSIAVFYHLWRILHNGEQTDLAIASASLGGIHILMMFVVMFRCREDKKLQAVLGILGTAFITAALPMYFKLQAALIGWAIEAVVLTFIGIHYRSLWTKAMAILVAGISTAGLFYHLPLHDDGEFTLILNQPFGTWIFVALAVMVCHALWRFMPLAKQDETSPFQSQVFYVWGRLLIGNVLLLEWYAHCNWHIEGGPQGEAYFYMGGIVIMSLWMLGYLLRPVCPAGQIVRTTGLLFAIVGAIFTASVVPEIYYDAFVIFANVPFAITLLFVAALLVSAWFVNRERGDTEGQFGFAAGLVFGALLLLWLLLSEQVYLYWYCKDAFGPESIDSWEFSAQMYMSVMWAIYGAILLIVGFITRAKYIRYLSLVVFAVLLAKIFIMDTATLRTEYRITAFITTGLVLVGVSFLYQMLKKKGFFDAMEKQISNTEQISKAD